MIDREGAAVLAQVAGTFFVALAVSSVVVHHTSNPIRKLDTVVEFIATFATLVVAAAATAISAFGWPPTRTTTLLLGIVSTVAGLCVAYLLQGVLVERLRRAGEESGSPD